MFNFTFQNPTKILFGKGRIADLAREIPSGSKVMLTYGGGSARRYGILDQVHQSLAGYEVREFGGIEPNPSCETLMAAVELVRREKIDFLLAAGGGSVIDGTKFIAAAANYDRDPWEIIETGGRNLRTALPLGTILTLPASGSEMNGAAVISRRSTNTKSFFTSRFVLPRFSILDPSLSFTLPAAQVINGIIDTWVHITEQYLTYPVQALVQDRFAEGLLLTLRSEGRRALTEPDNYDVRANLMWCSTLAQNGLIGLGVPQDWATHMLGQELTALYGIEHGQTVAVLLPAMLEVRKESKKDKLVQYARRVWEIAGEGDEGDLAELAIQQTRSFFASLGAKRCLADFGLDSSHIPAVLANLAAKSPTAYGERRDVTPEVLQRVLELAL